MNGDTPKTADDQHQSDAGSWQYTPDAARTPAPTPTIESAPQASGPAPAPESNPAPAEPTLSVEQPLAPSTPRSRSDVPQDVIWTASEFVAHNKSLNWYGLLIAGAVGLAAV
ncbi:MAG: hypothetical protein ABWX94_01455, partial [Candidatus Saccharimonadales bacterium]